MLRDQKAVGTGMAASLRERVVGWLAMAVLCAVGLGVIGLRAPNVARAENQVAGAESVEKSTTARSEKKAYDFSYVPENTMALFAVRQAELAADPRLRPLADLLDDFTRPSIPSKLAEQTTLALVAPDLDEQGRMRAGFSPEQIVFHTTEPVDFEAYLKKTYTSLRDVPDGGFKILASDANAGAMSFYMPDSKTLLGRGRSGLVQLLVNRNAALPPKNAEKWQAEAKGPFLVVVQGAPTAKIFNGGVGPFASILAPLLKNAETLVFSAEAGEKLKLVGRVACKTPEDANRAAETIRALAVLAENLVAGEREHTLRNVPTSPPRDMLPMLDLIDRGLAARQIQISGSDVQIEMTFGTTDDAVKLIVEVLAPAVRAARAAAHRTTSTNNLKQIALAMHLYADKEKHFPPAVLIGPDGKTPYSWRVALLPHLGHDALYKQYRFDQPWDSAENRKVL